MLIGNDARVGRDQDRRTARHHQRPAAGRPRRRTEEARFRPDIVVILDGSRKLRALPGAVQLLQEGPHGRGLRHLPGRRRTAAARRMPGRRRRGRRPGTRPAGDGARRSPRSDPTSCRPTGAPRLARSIAPIRDVSSADDGVGAPGLCPAAGCAEDGAAVRHPDREPLAGRRPVHAGSHRRVLRRAVRHRHQQGRAARADRGDDRLREVGAAADDRRLARRREPARRDDVRAHRLQGRQRVRRVRAAAAHRRHGHRPGPAPSRTGPGIAVGRAHPARAHPGRGRRQGHRGLSAPRRRAARAVRCRAWSSSSTSSRP